MLAFILSHNEVFTEHQIINEKLTVSDISPMLIISTNVQCPIGKVCLSTMEQCQPHEYHRDIGICLSSNQFLSLKILFDSWTSSCTTFPLVDVMQIFFFIC